MGNITNGCSGIHGAVNVLQEISTIEGLLADPTKVKEVLHHLKIVVRDATGYLDESTLPRTDNPNFIQLVKGILNGVSDVLKDKVD